MALAEALSPDILTINLPKSNSEIFTIFRSHLANGIDLSPIEHRVSQIENPNDRFKERNRLINTQVGEKLRQPQHSPAIILFLQDLEWIREIPAMALHIQILSLPDEVDQLTRTVIATELEKHSSAPATAWRNTVPGGQARQFKLYEDDLERLDDTFIHHRPLISHDQNLLFFMRQSLGL